jgi:hypothetical protein
MPKVAILPYYVANLNIEATYAAITGEYKEFPNLCFVDTLDNTYGLRKHKGHIDDLFGGVSDDNVRRIRQQNSRRISVIVGNPPYNANQLNENENNKNREYPEIDKRIKETYIAESTAQKTKLYDMYARFFVDERSRPRMGSRFHQNRSVESHIRWVSCVVEGIQRDLDRRSRRHVSRKAGTSTMSSESNGRGIISWSACGQRCRIYARQ